MSEWMTGEEHLERTIDELDAELKKANRESAGLGDLLRISQEQKGELEAEVAKLKADAERIERLFLKPLLEDDQGRDDETLTFWAQDYAHAYGALCSVNELAEENVKLKAERDRYKRDAECYASECGDPHVEENELYRLREEVAKLKEGVPSLVADLEANEADNRRLREENARLLDLLRWRKTSEEPPTEPGNVLMKNHRNELAVVWVCNPKLWAGRNAGLNWPYWRPLGPLPGATGGEGEQP